MVRLNGAAISPQERRLIAEDLAGPRPAGTLRRFAEYALQPPRSRASRGSRRSSRPNRRPVRKRTSVPRRGPSPPGAVSFSGGWSAVPETTCPVCRDDEDALAAIFG